MSVLLLLSWILTMFTVCRKNDHITNPEIDVPEDKEITATISGKVWDEEGFPINGAVITAGGSTAQTNELGSFSMENVKLLQRNGFIQIEKEGYFKGFKTISVDAGRVNEIEVKLQKRTVTATFSATVGATVVVDDGSQIIFDPGAIINDADKSSYSGNVKVYAKYIDPTAEDFLKIMPGNLVGITANKEEVRLVSFGMLNVELEGESGQKLQLAQGKPATISSVIPEQLLNQATASIPLWYMDEEDGIWKEEGLATKDGNRFTGKVSHFSFWNYDYYSGAGLQLYKIKARFVNKSNAPVAYKRFTISTGSVTHQEDITDSTGSIDFMGSQDSMIIKLWVTPCNDNSFIFKVGPFTNDTDLGNLIVDDTSSTNILKGKLAVCDNRVLQIGGLLFLSEGTQMLQSTSIDRDGNFIIPESEACLTGKSSINFKFYNSNFVLLKDTSMIFPKGITDIGSIQSCIQNKPPVVNAGSDQEVVVGKQVYLSATANDPDGNIASYLWQKVSGPEGDAISHSASLTTTVSFTNEGMYKFRIIVTDNEGATANDDISIKVNAASASDSSAIKISIDTLVFNIVAPTDEIAASRSGDQTKISGKTVNYSFGNPNYAVVSLSFSGNPSEGTYITEGFINAGAGAYLIKDGSSKVSGYGNVNQFIEGKFSGEIIRAADSSKTNPATIPTSIVFKAIRKQ